MTTAKSSRRRGFNGKNVVSRSRIERVVAEVSAEVRIAAPEILGASRERRKVAARWECWRRLIGANDSIASLARNWPCDRTAILHALNKLEGKEQGMKLIGITGTKGSGKDTAAAALSGYENVKMAGALKAMLRAMLAYQGVHEMLIDRMIDGDLKEVPSKFFGGRSPRHAMVTLGTEWGRNLLADDLWIGIAERRIALFDNVVVSDVRFPNEVDMVKRLGGEVFRVERVGAAPADPHPSEAQIATLEVDGVLPNGFPSAEAFQGYVRATVL